MDNATQGEFFDIEGSAGAHRCCASLNLGMAAVGAVVGWGLWSLAGGSAGFADEFDRGPAMLAVMSCAVSVVMAVSLARRRERHVYLDINRREIVFVSSRAWWEVGTRPCPLTEFNTIVVRHLCHPGGEVPDSYTGSVGLRLANRGAVRWVRDFPATEDEVPRDAFKFARKLQAMTGLPVAGAAEFNQESHPA